MVALLAVYGASALAEDREPIDITTLPGELTILHDGNGHYLATTAISNKKTKATIFYGDGKTFYQQRLMSRTVGSKTSPSKQWIWSPTSPFHATLKRDRKKWSISCSRKLTTALTTLSDAETTKLLKKAKFYPRFWNKEVQVLSRDENANYYLVDAAPKKGARDFSMTDVTVYRGPVGRLKKLKLKEVASDAEGFVLVTKSGVLLIDRTKDGSFKARWKSKVGKGKRAKVVREDLRIVSHTRNEHMIYTTLGVYPARIGTPCDDLYAED